MSRQSQLDATKKHLDYMINFYKGEKIIISDIRAATFNINRCKYPIALLDYAVSKLRDKNIIIHWNLDDLSIYNDGSINAGIYHLYEDPFWRLISNHDTLIFDTYQKALENCFEQLFDLLKHVNVLEFRFVGRCTNRKFLEELLDIIRARFNSEIFIYDFNDMAYYKYISES